MKDLSVLIVGAGIGGLSTALALSSDGHKVIVLEGVKEFLEVLAFNTSNKNEQTLNNNLAGWSRHQGAS
jgi:2-polyprenyl-6-methoxyphenol hydroxylase-like FAD-dependent oxidoreductase